MTLQQYLEQFDGERPFEKAYQEYLSRHSFYQTDSSYTGYRGLSAMTYDEYVVAHKRWDAEYDQAWEGWQGAGVPPVAAELEALLLV